MILVRALRLAWIIAAVLATGGASAAPPRVVESTRLVATCAWLRAEPAKQALAPHARPQTPSAAARVVRVPSNNTPRAPQVFPTLFQRPPPATT
jgi:hypothetical protein